MSPTAASVPSDPLARFCELYTALLEDRPWWQGRDMLRFGALALTTLPGEPRALAAALERTVEELRQARPWYKRSSVGTLLAAVLLRQGESAAGFFAELDRAAPLFREHWRFGGSTYEALAVAALRQRSPDGRVSSAQVARLAEIWKLAKAAHPWLTQKSDWPACALLASSSESPSEISARLESIYEGLRARGFSRGEDLQAATQILFFHPEPSEPCCARFQALYAGFRQSGLWMGSSDFDEVALLCFAPQDASSVLGSVARHRSRIAELPSRPDKQTSFGLACGTALLELARGSPELGLLSDAQLFRNIQTILAAQQAAAAAAS